MRAAVPRRARAGGAAVPGERGARLASRRPSRSAASLRASRATASAAGRGGGSPGRMAHAGTTVCGGSGAEESATKPDSRKDATTSSRGARTNRPGRRDGRRSTADEDQGDARGRLNMAGAVEREHRGRRARRRRATEMRMCRRWSMRTESPTVPATSTNAAPAAKPSRKNAPLGPAPHVAHGARSRQPRPRQIAVAFLDARASRR